jgi:hypothetical protein
MDTELKLLAVAPTGSPFASRQVTTVTPVAKEDNASRNSRVLKASVAIMGSIFTGQKQAAIIGDSTAKLRLYRKLSKLIVLNMLNNINHYPFLTIYLCCAFSLLLALSCHAAA